MKNICKLLIPLAAALLVSCGGKTVLLFDGGGLSKWNVDGNVAVNDSIMTLSGYDARALLRSGYFDDFVLSMELRTTPGGKGALWFHTDKHFSGGYRVAINNDHTDPCWWKMTGSLVSVRNITNMFARDDQWFKMDVRVEGRGITVTIDGRPVVEYTEPDEPYRTGINENARLSSGKFNIVSSGTGEIQFRNISVVRLDGTVDKEAQLAKAIDERTDPIIRLHQEDFPVLDYHVHLKGGLTKEQAARQSRRLGINYAIAPNCGIGFAITNDQDVAAYLDTMRNQPFISAMQAEGREWLHTFSKEAREGFDFVFTDALTFTDDNRHRTRLWIPEETWIWNEQEYMDMILDRICRVLQEPVDVYVNPCFLPSPMDKKFDEFWTEARMDRFVAELAKSGKALEINELYRIPNKAIIKKAKAAAVKFTFGTNNVTPEVSNLEYSLKMKEECGLKAEDMYKPRIKL